MHISIFKQHYIRLFSNRAGAVMRNSSSPGIFSIWSYELLKSVLKIYFIFTHNLFRYFMKRNKKQVQQPDGKKNLVATVNDTNPESGGKLKMQQKYAKTHMSTEAKVSNPGIWMYYAAFLIVVGTLLVYSNTFRVPFQFDDKQIFEYNAISHIEAFGEISFWTHIAQRQFSWLTLAINYHWSGANVFGYHVFNVMFHLITGWIIYILLIELLSLTSLASYKKIVEYKQYFALFGALLFLLHPMQTQAVTYIIQRMASLVALFYLLSVYWYIKARMKHINSGINGKTLLLYFLTFVSFVFALFSKENAVTLPLSLLLTEFFFIRDQQGRIFKKYLVICSSSIAVLILSAILIRGLPRDAEDISRSTYLITEFNVIIRYILMLVLPIGQNVDHDIIPSVSIFGVKEIASLGMVLGLLYLGYYMFNKNRLISFGIFWFFLTLSVESTLIPIKDYMFEHRVYLPSFGFFIALIAGLFYLKDIRIWKKTVPAAILVLILLIIPYGAAAYLRNSIWKTELSLWTDSIKKSPQKGRPYNNRGLAFAKEEKFDLALNDFNKSIELSPNYVPAYYNRGIIFAKEKKYDKAIIDFNKAMDFESNDAKSYTNRGVIFMSKNKYDKALNDFNKAIELNPSYAPAYFNRGFVFAKQEQYNKALNDFNKAIEINPTYSDAYNKRGVNFINKKEYDKAIIDFNKAIELNATNAEAYFNRGLVFEKEEKSNLALNEYSKAIDLDPTYAEAFNSRGIFFMNAKMLGKALIDFEKAIQLKPDFAEAFNNRAKLFSSERKYVEAVNDWDKAIELNPDFTLAYYNRGTILMIVNKNTEAFNDFTKTIKLKPDFVEAYFNLGAILFREKRYEEAISNYTKAITFRPGYAEAYFNRAINEFYSGKKGAACIDWKQAASLGYKPAADELLLKCK